jgi:hypothetical protein
MKQIEEDMKKEGIKFERLNPKEVWEWLQEDKELFLKLEKQLKKKGLLVE